MSIKLPVEYGTYTGKFKANDLGEFASLDIKQINSRYGNPAVIGQHIATALNAYPRIAELEAVLTRVRNLIDNNQAYDKGAIQLIDQVLGGKSVG